MILSDEGIEKYFHEGTRKISFLYFSYLTSKNKTQ